MRLHQETIELRRAQGLHDITRDVAAIVARSGVRTGLCTVFVQHTSASLVVQENADPSVQRDLARWIAKLCPESSSYEHDAEGPDDMPAHLRASMLRTNETIPISESRLTLGTWQAIYLWEHRRGPHTRRVVVHVQGA
jgi:secondary thiamine-phosphate synthase enzyme